MTTHQRFFILFFCFIPFSSFAQRYISGQVADVNGVPISDVHVFFASTTVGIITDSKGYYRLQIPGEGSYRLAASHVGFKPIFVDVKPGRVSLRIDIKMQENEIEDVIVSATVNFRKRDIDLFWETFLGVKSSKNTIYAVNPQDAFYKYDTKTSILRVTSRVPLEVINVETGYRMLFVLNEFTHDYKSRLSSWDGECRFFEIEPENDRQRELWKKNREEIYKVSLNLFIKSLYNNTLMDNGFLLIHEGKTSPFVLGTLNKIDLATPDNYLIQDSTSNNKTLYIEPYSEALILVCYGKPVTERDLGNVMAAQNRHKRWEIIGTFRNVLQTPENPVHIFSDGTYMNTMLFSPFFSTQSLTGLNMLLPTEYDPESVFGSFSPDILAGTYSDRINNVAMRFTKQLIVSPQEKVYLHTDKPYYVTGEQIWFRAHVVNAAVHIPVISANSIYVELFDAKDLAVSRVKIGLENGIFSGYIPIPKDIPEGNYTLRAYTNTMRDLDEDYFFMKNIHIGNPITRIIPTSTETKTDHRVSRQPVTPLPENDFDVSFYPEGGYALYGSTGRIAFKALQQNGNEIEVDGVLYDSRKNEITRFKTDVRGMGQFLLTPQHGEKYHAVCSNSHGQEKQFELPDAHEEAYALSATWCEDSLIVKLHQSESANKLNPMFLIVHTRGIIQDVSILDNIDKPVVYHKDIFPSGVTNFILLNSDLIPVSERLVFVLNNNDQTQVECMTDMEIYPVRSPVEYSVDITDVFGEPLQGSVSVSVTNDNEVAVDTTFNILTSLLLTSDLRGNISDPAIFFQNKHALDLLMLTQGWRRYDTEKIIRNDLVYPDTLLNMRHGISGTVNRKRLFKKKPEENANVSFFSFDGNFFDVTVTDRNGRFYFPESNAPDSTWLIVQVASKGRNERELTLNAENFPSKAITTVDFKVPDHRLSKYIIKAEQQFVEEKSEGSGIEHLSEVTITAQAPVRKSSYYSMPDQTVNVSQLRIPPSSMNQLLTRLPGVVVTDTAAYLFRNLYRGSPIPVLWLVDDMPAGFQPPDYLMISDIVQIDLLTSPANLTMFGRNGTGGVIAIHTDIGQRFRNVNSRSIRLTQRGGTQLFDSHIKRIMPLGFQKPAEFYAPKYDQPAQNPKPDLRTTIHWKPDLITDGEGKASFRFYTADTPSTYTVVIEGVTEDGKLMYKRDKIMVGGE